MRPAVRLAPILPGGMRAVLLLFALLLVGPADARPRGKAAPTPTPRAAPPAPSLADWGFFLSKLDEDDKGAALGLLADLAADPHLPSDEVDRVLRRMLDDGPPPEGLGYWCDSCVQRRLSKLLTPLRLRGPETRPPQEAIVAWPVDDKLLRALSSAGAKKAGGKVPSLVVAMLQGFDLADNLRPDRWIRYHDRERSPRLEPVLFTDADALAAVERDRTEPLEAWDLARWMGLQPPKNRYEPGFVLLYFDPKRACGGEVRVPTAADTEDPWFRPSPEAATVGASEGGAPQWACPNFQLEHVTRTRYVPHGSYVEGLNPP